MSTEICLPVLKTKRRAKPYAPFEPMDMEYTRITRRIKTIEKQIDNLYRKYGEFINKHNVSPTHVILNDVDLAFFKAYARYRPYQMNGMDYKFETTFGLKILTTKFKRPTFAWEP
jgi:hypothetical protein